MDDPRSGEPDRDKDRDELGQSETQSDHQPQHQIQHHYSSHHNIIEKVFVFLKISIISSIFQTTEHKFKI